MATPAISRAFICPAVLLLSLAASDGGSQPPRAGGHTSAVSRSTQSFAQKLLRISGIAFSPSTLKGPGDEIQTGQIWLADIAAHSTRRLTANSGYRSPVFMPNGDILAVDREKVVRLSAAKGVEPKSLFINRGIAKLVGFSMDDPDKVLVLMPRNDGAAGVGLLSITTGRVTALAYDASSSEDRHMIEHLRSWDRVYGDKHVYVRHHTEEEISGPVEWTDVYLHIGNERPVNVSRCDGIDCGQPSLSADGRLLVFIRAARVSSHRSPCIN